MLLEMSLIVSDWRVKNGNGTVCNDDVCTPQIAAISTQFMVLIKISELKTSTLQRRQNLIPFQSQAAQSCCEISSL